MTRTFADFNDYWMSNVRSVPLGPLIATLTEQDRATLEGRVLARLKADAQGRITASARAHAVKGRRR